MDWDLNPDQRHQLRSTINSRGWSIWDRALEQIEADCIEQVADVEEESRWRNAKGQLAMVRQIRDLAEELVKVSEIGRDEWIRKRMLETQTEMAEMQEMILGGRGRVAR